MCNEQESLCQYDYAKSAKFDSTLTLNGSLVDKFVWADKLGPYPMNTLALYAEHGASAVPVWMHRQLHKPMKAGTIDTNYSGFVAGAPEASAFAVPGIETCEEGTDAQCSTARALAQLRVSSLLW
jgi:hypothetical protein